MTRRYTAVRVCMYVCKSVKLSSLRSHIHALYTHMQLYTPMQRAVGVPSLVRGSSFLTDTRWCASDGVINPPFSRWSYLTALLRYSETENKNDTTQVGLFSISAALGRGRWRKPQEALASRVQQASFFFFRERDEMTQRWEHFSPETRNGVRVVSAGRV